MKTLVTILIGLVLVAHAAEARVVRFVVERTTPFSGGKHFASAGPFEQLEGTVYMEVDPRDPLNTVIVNLDRAPRNSRGLVEFSAPFVIIKPVNMARGNQKIVYGINNRGNVIELDRQSFPAQGGQPPYDAGDGLIFRLGYTFVDAGWAGDVTSKGLRIGANLPVAVNADGSPVVANIRIEYSGTGHTLPLKGNDSFGSYETADTNTKRSTLTVRDSMNGQRRLVPADGWAFGRCPTGRGSLVQTSQDICVFDGFDENCIYELIYPAHNPWVMGLGYAVTRDVGSFLRYAAKDDAGHPNPLLVNGSMVGIRRVYGTGSSSTGMYLRDYLYLGCNEDEAHRKVFDAIRIAVPGTHRLFANVEFADPNIYSGQDQHQDYLSSSYPPLTYAVTTDPISGIRDGILKRPATDPLVLHVDTGNEFWQMNASLNVHDGRGRPIAIPEGVRLYMLSNHAHVGASGVAAVPTAKNRCEYVSTGTSNSRSTVNRALLVMLDEWADKGVPPAPNRYPDVRDNTLVTLDEAARAFPAIPGLKFPTALNELYLLNYGAGFGATGGRLTTLPPVRGAQYQVRVPRPGPDGVDMGGIKTVDIAAPVGTNLSWNLRAGARGSDLCGLSGSFLPFSVTKADRLAKGDARLSLEERYADHAGFVKAVEQAARQLVKERFLLEEDSLAMIKIAEASNILRP